MKISVADTEAQSTQLLRGAEAGGDGVRARHGHPVWRLVPKERGVLLEKLRAAAQKAMQGPCAARSQDFLYDEDGLPLGSQPGKNPLDPSMR
jgi:antitoxin (DNA-binding transcriptional repressor) of toxin-antitoxin stability system